MADRKRQRTASKSLRSVLHTGGISLKGLAEVLDKLRGIDAADCTMHSVRLANEEDFSSVKQVITLTLIDGGTWDWELANPSLLLQLAVTKSPWLQAVFAQARKPTLSEPWRIVIGFDEFTPGFRVVHDLQYTL